MKEPDYVLLLTQEDKIRVAFRQNHGKIEHFIVQYYALMDGRWRTIMRIDTCHSYAHKHTFHANNRQYVVRLPGDLNIVFTESTNFVTKNFEKIKENYLMMS